MKAAMYYGNKDIRIEDIPEPTVRPGTVKVKIEWCGICGTDLHEYLDGPIFAPPAGAPHPLTGETVPVCLGHEFAGVVRDCPADGASEALLAARQEALSALARLISPFAPHLAEECWERLGGEGLIARAPWPVYDAALAADDERVLPVQINGKRRGEIRIKAGTPEDEVKKIALEDAGVLPHLEGVTVRKVIVVQDRIVNIVVG